MPLITVAKFFATLASLAVLGLGGYLAWSWWEGDVVQTADGALVTVREDWRLWTALALLAFSALGRFLIVPLIATGGDKPEDKFERLTGRTAPGARSSALYIETSGQSITPDAPTFVLTHGQGMDTTFWSPIRKELAKNHRVIAWDLPGLGRSKRIEGSSFSLDDGAAELEAVIHGTGGPLILVGHSLGGMIIQHLAQQRPGAFNRVVGAVLLNTTYVNPTHTMVLSALARALQKPVLEPMSHFTKWIEPLAWLGNWQSYWSGWAHLANRLQFGSKVTRAQLEHVTLVGTRNPPGVIAAGNLGMFHWRGLEDGAIGAPVLIIAGGKDIVTKSEASETIASRLANTTLKVVAAANHMGPIEQSRVYAGAIERFADKLSVSPQLAK
jgi:pimeloyl-ACP methyl ester carboxylesterase